MLDMPVFLFFCIALMIALLPLALGQWLYSKKLIPEKTLAPYECGFPPFSDAHIPINIQYVIIALLFLIFDLEIIFLFPWAALLRYGLSFDAFLSGLLFFAILLIGLFYEWRQGALEWQ